MEINRIRFIEHLAIDCPLSLEEFCHAMQQKFGLPDFEFDFENETEWDLVEYEGIEYNISRPYEPDTWGGWVETVPAGCNFAITLQVSEDCSPEQNIHWSFAELVPSVGQRLADLFMQPVYHYRTWFGVGRSKTQKQTFHPK
jgi:hypothetical protein